MGVRSDGAEGFIGDLSKLSSPLLNSEGSPSSAGDRISVIVRFECAHWRSPAVRLREEGRSAPGCPDSAEGGEAEKQSLGRRACCRLHQGVSRRRQVVESSGGILSSLRGANSQMPSLPSVVVERKEEEGKDKDLLQHGIQQA